jgi:hypothetical protein
MNNSFFDSSIKVNDSLDGKIPKENATISPDKNQMLKIMDHRASRFGTKSRERIKNIEKPIDPSLTPSLNTNEPNILRISKNGSINSSLPLGLAQ